MNKQKMGGKAGSTPKSKGVGKKTSRPVSAKKVDDSKQVNMSRKIADGLASHTQLLKSLTTEVKSLKKQPSQQRTGISAPHMHTKRQHGFANKHIESGEVFVTSLTGSTTLSAGDIMYSRRNRAQLAGSQLQVWGGIYTRWKVIKQNYVYIPAVGTTFNGQILMAQDPDPTVKYDVKTTIIQQLTALVGNSRKQAYEPATCTMIRTKQHDNLYTQDIDANLEDYTERFSAAGNLFVVCLSPGNMNTGNDIGTLWLHYTYEFSEPRLQFNTVADPSNFKFDLPPDSINPDEGFHIFDRIMKLVNSVTLTASLLTTMYDSVATYFDWIPYVLDPEDDDSDGKKRIMSLLDFYDDDVPTSLISKRIDRGLGAMPGDAPGFAPGNYSVRLWFCVSFGCMGSLTSTFLTNGNFNPTTGEYTPPDQWITYGLEGKNYTNSSLNSTYAGPVFSTIGGGSPYQLVPSDAVEYSTPFDEETYAAIYTFEVSYSIMSKRGYYDMRLHYNNNITPTFSNVLQVQLNALNAVRIYTQFSNKPNLTHVIITPTTTRIRRSNGKAPLPSPKKNGRPSRELIPALVDNVIRPTISMVSEPVVGTTLSSNIAATSTVSPIDSKESKLPLPTTNRRESTDSGVEVVNQAGILDGHLDQFIAMNDRIRSHIEHLVNNVLNSYKVGSPEYVTICNRITSLKEMLGGN